MFGNFKDHIDNEDQRVDEDYMQKVYELCVASADLYKTTYEPSAGKVTPKASSTGKATARPPSTGTKTPLSGQAAPRRPSTYGHVPSGGRTPPEPPHIKQVEGEIDNTCGGTTRSGGEQKRWDVLRPILRELLGELTDTPRSGISLDGWVITTVKGTTGYGIVAMAELKNEIGTGGSDPNIQGAYYFLKLWARDEVGIL